MTNTDGCDVPWSDIIGSIGLVRRELADLEPDVFMPSGPGLAAEVCSIELLERKLGYQLDEQYRAFLQWADGWPNFFSDISILGVDDIGAGSAWTRAAQLLTTYYNEVDGNQSSLPLLGELFPVAVSSHQSDVLALIRTSQKIAGGRSIIWLANGPIEQFENLEGMLLFFLQEMLDIRDSYASHKGSDPRQ